MVPLGRRWFVARGQIAEAAGMTAAASVDKAIKARPPGRVLAVTLDTERAHSDRYGRARYGPLSGISQGNSRSQGGNQGPGSMCSPSRGPAFARRA